MLRNIARDCNVPGAGCPKARHPAPPLPLRLFAGTEFGGQVFDGLAIFEVLLYDLGDFLFVEAEVPGAGRVDDHVRAVLAEAEALDFVYPDVPVHPFGAQLAFELFLQVFGTALFAVAAVADQDVRVVVAYLRRRAGLYLAVSVSILFSDGLLRVKSS